MSNNIFFSVIIPVFNAEKYLKQCIESVINQSFNNFEIILIDDGSTDGSGDICDYYSEKEKKIQVFHNSNHGAGYSRNYGIKKCSGKYILFLDSDDYINNDLLAICFREIVSKKSSIVVFGFDNIDENENEIARYIPNVEKDIYYEKDIKELLIPKMIYVDKKEDSINMWFNRMCVIEKKLIDNLKWEFESEKKVLSEDMCSMIELFWNANSISLIFKNLYHYRFNPNSITKKYNDNNLSLCKNMYYYLKEKKYINRNQDLICRVEKNFLSYIIYIIKNISKSNNLRKDKIKDIKMISNDPLVMNLINKNKKEFDITKKIFFDLIRMKKYYLILFVAKIKK